jgi:hypothetical protein
MFPIALILTTFLTAPVPKEEAKYEGHIAVLFAKPSPSILLLKPNGEEVKRILIDDIEGLPCKIFLARNAKFAIITTFKEQDDLTRCYIVKLMEKGKTTLLHTFPKHHLVHISISKDMLHCYYSQIVIEDGNATYLNLKIDLDTKKKEKIDIDNKYSLRNMSQSPDDVLLAVRLLEERGIWEIVALSVETKKVVSKIEGSSFCKILADGKSVLVHSFVMEQFGNRYENKIRYFGKQELIKVPLPDKEKGVVYDIFSVSTDGEHVAYNMRDHDVNTDTNTYKIVVANFKKNTAKVIYKTNESLVFRDFDWR